MFKWLSNKIDPPIDYTGQFLSEKCLYTIFILGYTLSFVSGLLFNDLIYTLYGSVATFVVALLVIVPSWPFLRKNPVKFVEVEKEKKE